MRQRLACVFGMALMCGAKPIGICLSVNISPADGTGTAGAMVSLDQHGREARMAWEPARGDAVRIPARAGGHGIVVDKEQDEQGAYYVVEVGVGTPMHSGEKIGTPGVPAPSVGTITCRLEELEPL